MDAQLSRAIAFSHFNKLKIKPKKSEISDVIIHFAIFKLSIFEKGLYFNAMTWRISGNIENVIRNKRYILYKPYDDGIFHGFYIYKDELMDILIKVEMEFKFRLFRWKWVEKYRIGICGDMGFCSKASTYDYPSVDIGGQVLHTYNSELLETKYRNMPYDARNKMLAYTNDVFFTDSIRPAGYSFDDNIDYLPLFNHMVDGGYRYMQEGFGVEWDDIPDIPSEKISSMQTIYLALLNKHKTPFHDILCYLDNVGGKLILRYFKPTYEYADSVQKTKVKVIEWRRVLIDENTERSFLNKHVIGVTENIKGTFLEHTIYILNEWIDDMERAVSDIRIGKCSLIRFERTYLTFNDLNVTNIFALCVYMGKQPIIEKCCKIKCKNAEYIRKELSYMIYNSSFMDVDDMIFGVFGELGKGNSLNQMLCLPKGLFEYIVDFESNNANLSSIRDIKALFSDSDESMHYFMNMSCGDYRYLIDCIFMQHQYIEYCLQYLIDIYGYKNWKNYLKHLMHICESGDICKYYDYIMMVNDLKDIVENMRWKVSGGKIDKAIDSIAVAHYLIEEKDEYEEMLELFRKCAAGWKQYRYTDEEFLITYPKRPEELVQEGVSLNHCAKEFIPAVADGDTMILFIRRQKQPDKPFFTLEIRDNEIRQCHGFDNCNMTNEVRDFLEKYCKEKDIIFQKGEKMLGVYD